MNAKFPNWILRPEIIWKIIFPVLIIKRQSENDRLLLTVANRGEQIRRGNASRR